MRQPPAPPPEAPPTQPEDTEGDVGGRYDCEQWRQGDCFKLDAIWHVAATGDPELLEVPYGVVLISQSCDASQPGRSHVQVAPARMSRNAGELAEAKSGKRVSLVPLAGLPEGCLVDLEIIGTVHKAVLANVDRVPSPAEPIHERRFRDAVARKFGRFAFPDAINLAVGPVKSALRSKARKENTPLGKVLAGVRSVRVEAVGPSGWDGPEYQLTLHVIFEPGVLPPFMDDDEPFVEPTGLRARVAEPDGSLAGRSAAIAQAIIGSLEPAERQWLWNYMGECWASECESSARGAGVADAIGEIAFELVTIDEFSLARFVNSEDLDLDDLSDPRR